MSSRRARLAASGLLFFLLSQAARAAVLDPRDISFRVTPSGLRVIVKEDHFAPVVAIEVLVKVGSADETPAQAGAAHLLEHLAFAGSGSYGPGEIALRIDGTGGTINAATQRDFTHYYATVPAAQFSLALRLLADAVLRPTLPRPALEQERLAIVNEQLRLADQPIQWLWDLSFQAAFAKHPYGRPIAGPRPNPLAREDLLQFHKLWYAPNNISVIIVGDVSAARARAEAEQAFRGSLPRPLPQAKRPSEPPLPGIREISRKVPWKQAYLMLSFRAPGLENPREVVAADLALSLLGEGQSSRLRRDLKEKQQLVLGAGVEYLTQKDPSLFSIWAVCAPDRVKAVREALLEEVRRLRREPVPAQELEKAKRLLAATYTVTNETYSDQANSLAYYEGVGGYRFATEYLSLVNRLTGPELRAFALRYLDPERYVWAAAGPQERGGWGPGD